MLYADIKPNVDGCLIAGDFGSCEFRFALSAIWLILAIALGSALLPEMIQKMQSGTLSITDLPWPLCMLGTLFLVGYLFKYLYLRSERNNAEITIWVTAQFTSEELSTSP